MNIKNLITIKAYLLSTSFRFIVIVALLTLLNYSIKGQNKNIYGETAYNMITLLGKNHYNPLPANEDLSKKAWFNFFNFLDPYHLVFLEKDVRYFSNFKMSLGLQVMEQSTEFLSEVTSLYENRLNETDSIIDVICKSSINLSEKDNLIYRENDSLSYPENRDEQKKRWQKRIKHRELQLMITSDKEYFKKDIDSLLKKEPAYREKVKKNQKRIFQRILSHPSGFENYIASLYMNSFAICFDPHTYFLTPNNKKNFESEISPASLSFGFILDETQENEIKISRLIPGSPAWKSNMLHPGDILLEIKWGDKKSIDITGASPEEIYQILSESNSDKLTITIRMPNDLIEKVVLTKEKIKTDENLVKGIILNGEKKIGYISLPGFYTEWDNPADPGCANDVAKEILKLKEDSIEGLILDIRSNGGGSMTEALNLAGIFIDEGPLCIYHERGNKPITLKDMNRGTIYNGPLVVMVNAGSASASELVSDCLQDYHRAVIVGNPTFGKASGQIILPNDTSVNVASKIIPKSDSRFGYVITTTFKFYRIPGNSHQLSGVIPDIVLPDFYHTDNDREISNKNALPKDSVIKKVYFTPLPALPVQQLAMLSKKRCDNNFYMKLMTSLLDSLDSFLEIEKIPLDISSYSVLKRKIYHLTGSIDSLESSKNNCFKITNCKQNDEIFKIDEYGREMNEQFVDNLQKDALLEETYYIISDLINLMKKK